MRLDGVRRSRLSLIAFMVVTALVSVVMQTSEPSATRSVNATQPAAAPPPAPAASPTTDTSCGDPTASLRPPGAVPAPGAFAGYPYLKTIHDRGRLVVGVSQDTMLLGYLNPSTNQLEGFEVDLMRQMALAIFGDASRLELRVLRLEQRVPLILDGTLDLVAATFTVNCERRRSIDFSTLYYRSGQGLLVPKSSTVQSIDDLGGQRVCAPAGTTSIDNLARAASHPVPFPVPNVTDCLVRLQLGEVAAISTDESILRGLAAQDPSTTLVGPLFSDEPYGIGISLAHPDLVRFVNAVLQRMRTDGTWEALYQKWLGRFGPVRGPPQPRYRD